VDQDSTVLRALQLDPVDQLEKGISMIDRAQLVEAPPKAPDPFPTCDELLAAIRAA
jgi:hypothetical protein